MNLFFFTMIIYRTKLFFTDQELLEKYLKGHPEAKKEMEVESSWREKRYQDMKKFNDTIRKKHAGEMIRRKAIIQPAREKFSKDEFDPNFLTKEKLEELTKLSRNPNLIIKYHGKTLNMPDSELNGKENSCYNPNSKTVNLTDSGLNNYVSKHEVGHASSNSPDSPFRKDMEEIQSWKNYIKKIYGNRHQNDEFGEYNSIKGRKLSSYKTTGDCLANKLLFKDKYVVPMEELGNKCAIVDNYLLNGDEDWIEKFNNRREKVQEPGYKLDYGSNLKSPVTGGMDVEKANRAKEIKRSKLSPNMLDVAMTDPAGKDFKNSLNRYKSLTNALKEVKQEYKKTKSEETKNILKEKLIERMKLLKNLRK